jgi:hypothetical protein
MNEQIKQLVEQYPNDMELGGVIRKMYWDSTKKIYESPDGGKTVFERPFGGDVSQRKQIK